MLGEDLTTVRITENGLFGDRVFAVLDEDSVVGSAKHPRKWGPLLSCRSRLTGSLAVSVQVPDGTALRAGEAELDLRLSDLLGRKVSLSDISPEQGVLERAVPEYAGGVPDVVRERALVDETGDTITRGQVADGTFFDFGKVHLITTSSLRRLRATYPAGDFDPRRFLPNVVVDIPGEAGFPEDAWLGSTLRIGEVLFQVTLPTPRCVVPTLAHEELPADLGIMRAVAREHRVPVLNLGRLSCVGVYLDVLEPGVIEVGDTVTVASRH